MITYCAVITEKVTLRRCMGKEDKIMSDLSNKITTFMFGICTHFENLHLIKLVHFAFFETDTAPY